MLPPSTTLPELSTARPPLTSSALVPVWWIHCITPAGDSLITTISCRASPSPNRPSGPSTCVGTTQVALRLARDDQVPRYV